MCCSVLRCVVIGFITQTAASQLPSSLPSLTWWDNRPNLSAERERERNRNRERKRETSAAAASHLNICCDWDWGPRQPKESNRLCQPRHRPCQLSTLFSLFSSRSLIPLLSSTVSPLLSFPLLLTLSSMVSPKRSLPPFFSPLINLKSQRKPELNKTVA